MTSFIPVPRRSTAGLKLLPVLLALSLVASPASPVFLHKADASRLQPQAKSYDYWYVVKISGNDVGYLYETTTPVKTDAGSLTPAGFLVVSEMKMVLNRLGARVELGLKAESEESHDGRLLRIDYEHLASLMSIFTRARIDHDKNIIEVSKQAGPGAKPYSRTIDFRGKLLGPEGVRTLCLDTLKKSGDMTTFQTFSSEFEKVVTINRTVLQPEVLSIWGKDFNALKVEEAVADTPLKRTLWLKENGVILKQEEPSPFGLTEVILAEKQAALAAASGAELPEEMYERSIVRTNIRLPQPRSIEYLKLKIIQTDLSPGWPELDRPFQRVLAKSEGALTLEIKKPGPEQIPTIKYAPDNRLLLSDKPELREHLEPNAYLQSDAPEIQALVRDLLKGESDAFRAAKKLERWVALNMTFDLGIVFAPSSEIFKNRRGTCVGYATLLAALTRAAGIPSRVLMGFVYTHGMFGGHAWVELCLGDVWIPLDAAIIRDGAADASRFAFAASSLRDGAGVLLGAGAGRQMFGNIRVEVQEYAAEGRKKTAVPADAKPFTVLDDFYENPWLGIKIKKPAGFRFSNLDSAWPDLSVLAMQGPAGEKVELRQLNALPWLDEDLKASTALASLGFRGEAGYQVGKKESKRREKTSATRRQGRISGHLTVFHEAPSKSAAAVVVGNEVWVLIVEEPNAPELLKSIAQTLKFT